MGGKGHAQTSLEAALAEKTNNGTENWCFSPSQISTGAPQDELGTEINSSPSNLIPERSQIDVGDPR